MTPTPRTILSLRQATKRFESADSAFELRVPALDLAEGSVCVVAGRSGCGKTTLLDALGGISPWNSCEQHTFCPAEVPINMLRCSGRQRAAMRRDEIGYILQQGGLLPFLTAWENILLPMRLSGRSALQNSALELAATLGIADQLAKRPEALSIGQRQRVSIVRALALRPALILADEPTGALDPVSAAEVREQLISIAAEQGCGVIIVTHDVELFADCADMRLGFTLRREGNTTISELHEQPCGKEVRS